MRLAHLVVCLGVIGLAACSPQRPTVPAAPALRVVVPLNTPPYAFRQENRLVGLEVDFARELAAALRRPLDLVETDFGDIIPAVQQQRADLAMAGLTITRARQVLIGFSDPYLRSGLLAAMRREDVPRFKSASSVLRTSEPIGVVAGTTGDRFALPGLPGKLTLAPRESTQRRAIAAQLGMRLPRLLVLRGTAIERPVGPQRLHDLVEVVGQTEDTARRQVGPPLLEIAQDGCRP